LRHLSKIKQNETNSKSDKIEKRLNGVEVLTVWNKNLLSYSFQIQCMFFVWFSQNSNRRRRNQYSEAELESRRVQGSDLISTNQMSDLEDLEYMVNSHRSDPLGALTMSHASRMTTR
jgi:hypothetical protein